MCPKVVPGLSKISVSDKLSEMQRAIFKSVFPIKRKWIYILQGNISVYWTCFGLEHGIKYIEFFTWKSYWNKDFKTFKVFLIYIPTCPNFNTQQIYALNLLFLQFFLPLSPICGRRDDLSIHAEFINAFTKKKNRKAPFSPHDCPSDESIRIYRRGFHRTYFHEVWYWILFYGNLSGKTRNVVEIGHMCRALYRRPKFIYVFWQKYEIFCSSQRVRRDPIVAFSWQHSTVLYCWQLRVGQQKHISKALLCFHGGSGYTNALQGCIIGTWPICLSFTFCLYIYLRIN